MECTVTALRVRTKKYTITTNLVKNVDSFQKTSVKWIEITLMETIETIAQRIYKFFAPIVTA